MSKALDSREAARDFALSLPGTELATGNGKPAVKIAANGRALLGTRRETFWQTPHDEGYGAVLVRFDSPGSERAQETIRLAHEQARRSSRW